jgi:HK97 family phage portal protein
MILEAISRSFERRAIKFDPVYPGDPGLAQLWGGGQPSRSGLNVNENTARGLTAVWRAVQFRSNVMGFIPRFPYERRPDGGNTRLTDHSLYPLLHDVVNPDLKMSAFTYQALVEDHVLTWGNAYAWIEKRGGRGAVALWPQAPNMVTIDLTRKGALFYVFHGVSEPDKTYGPEAVLHFKGPSPDGLIGWSRVRVLREAIGQGLAAQQFGAAYFGQGARMGVTVTTLPGFKPADAKMMKESIAEQAIGPDNWHRPLVLPGADKIIQTSFPPEDAQFIGTMEWGVTDAARAYGVPLVFMMLPNAEPKANAEQDTLNFSTTEISPQCRNYEQELNQKLLSPSERPRIFIEHDVKAMLRGDFKSRMEAYHFGLTDGLFDRDTCLRLENMDPLGEERGGLVRTVPVNSMNLEALIGQTAPPAAVTPPAKIGEPPVRSIDWLAMYDPLFKDGGERLLAKETKAIDAMMGKSRSHSDLSGDIATYYHGHRDAVRFVFTPIVRSMATIREQADGWVERFAERYCAAAHAEQWPAWKSGKAAAMVAAECRAAIQYFKVSDNGNQN